VGGGIRHEGAAGRDVAGGQEHIERHGAVAVVRVAVCEGELLDLEDGVRSEL
jgi:hypothetical protein